MLSLVRAMLTHAGHVVIGAASGREALTLFGKDGVDLVIMKPQPRSTPPGRAGPARAGIRPPLGGPGGTSRCIYVGALQAERSPAALPKGFEQKQDGAALVKLAAG